MTFILVSWIINEFQNLGKWESAPELLAYSCKGKLQFRYFLRPNIYLFIYSFSGGCREKEQLNFAFNQSTTLE